MPDARPWSPAPAIRFSAGLHAGAGVVRGSDPAAELAETGVKLDLLRRALGA